MKNVIISKKAGKEKILSESIVDTTTQTEMA